MQQPEDTDTEEPLTLTSAIEHIDDLEGGCIDACRELRAHVRDVFAATDDEARLLALQAGCDTEYELTGDTEIFSELAEQYGHSDALSDRDEERHANDGAHGK